jgi:predicted O-methyltransferase YrrM
MNIALTRQSRYGGALVAALCLMTPLTSPAAEGSPTDPEFRQKFIAGFPRTMLNTTPGDAGLLRILVESSQAKRGVEVGTATGYGAILMGLGFERNGGQLITVDIDPDMVRKARENLKAVGLEKTVTVVEGDALKVLPTLEGEFDFVFIDALKRDYFQYFKALAPKLKPGAVVVADNVIQSREDMKDFLDFMENSPDFQRVIVRASLEKNDGMAICYKRR